MTAQTSTFVVLLYSDDEKVRDQMRLGIGARPAPDLAIRFVEAATQDDVVRRVDEGDIDLVVLDGEAGAVRGLGITRVSSRTEVGRLPADLRGDRTGGGRWLRRTPSGRHLTTTLDPLTPDRPSPRLLRDRAVAYPPHLIFLYGGPPWASALVQPAYGLYGATNSPHRTPRGRGRDHGRRATPSQIAAFAVASGPKGETPARSRLVRGDAGRAVRVRPRLGSGVRVGRDAVDVVGTAGTALIRSTLHDGGDDVWRGRGACDQARQPGRVLLVRRGRPARAPGPLDRPGRGARCVAEGRPSASASPPVPQRPAPSRRTAREMGIPTAFNFLGPRPTGPAARGRRRGAPTNGWPRSWPRCSPAGRRVCWCCGARTADEFTPPRRPRVDGRRWRGDRVRCDAADLGLAGPAARTARGDAAANADVPARPGRRARPVRDASWSTPPRPRPSPLWRSRPAAVGVRWRLGLSVRRRLGLRARRLGPTAPAAAQASGGAAASASGGGSASGGARWRPAATPQGAGRRRGACGRGDRQRGRAQALARWIDVANSVRRLTSARQPPQVP